jgi:hypothetical protein
MLALIDCIGYPSQEPPKELMEEISCVGELIEVRAVAYKSLSVSHATFKTDASNSPEAVLRLSDLQSKPSVSNNLFAFWLVFQQTQTRKYSLQELSEDLGKMTLKAAFLQFIARYCEQLAEAKGLRANSFFDERVFRDTVTLIEQYYQIAPGLEMIADRRPGKL